MTDEQQGGIGCLVILLVIGGCYFYSSSKSEEFDADRMMDELVQNAQAESAAKIERLTNEYNRQKAQRENRYRAEAANLLNQLEVERRKLEGARTQQKEREAKQDDLRAFAMKESPDIWKTIQVLSAERDSINEKTKKVKDLLVQFNKNPTEDEDVLRLEEIKRLIEEQLAAVAGKLEAAYIAAKKYEAMPQRHEFEALMRKSIEEGVSAAEMAEKRYKELKRKE